MASGYPKTQEEERHVKWKMDQDHEEEEEEDDYGEEDEEEVKELRMENDLLRKENEELREELKCMLETVKLRNNGTISETKKLNISATFDMNTEVGLHARAGKIVNKVCSEGQKPGNSDEAECAKEAGIETLKGELQQGKENVGESCTGLSVDFGHSLSADAIRRYSRQLLVPSFGVAGQERLLKSSALVVGCGGLGSPIALYLAAAGVGIVGEAAASAKLKNVELIGKSLLNFPTLGSIRSDRFYLGFEEMLLLNKGCLGLVDHDVVELSNLHRQVIHTEAFVGKAKVKSAASACRGLNSSLQVLEYAQRLDAANAVEIVSKFDVVLDATDNLPTRYLLNDACVATGKPLVSGAALGVEGQVTVYNHKNGPCYRCLFPVPPPQGARQRCSDNGVIGVVPGIIGTFQALEALKLAGGVGETLNGRMLILDALSTRIHMVKLRGRNVACIACGDVPQISNSNLHQYDYEKFTQSPLSDEAPEGQHIIPESERISNTELKTRLESGQAHVLLDVRDAHEYAISRLPNSLNIPFSSLKENLHKLETVVDDSRQAKSSVSSSRSPAIYVVCRRGNDSQRAVQLLRNEGFTTAVDVIGGLESWVKTVNVEFPFY